MPSSVVSWKSVLFSPEPGGPSPHVMVNQPICTTGVSGAAPFAAEAPSGESKDRDASRTEMTFANLATPRKPRPIFVACLLIYNPNIQPILARPTCGSIASQHDGRHLNMAAPTTLIDARAHARSPWSADTAARPRAIECQIRPTSFRQLAVLTGAPVADPVALRGHLTGTLPFRRDSLFYRRSARFSRSSLAPCKLLISITCASQASNRTRVPGPPRSGGRSSQAAVGYRCSPSEGRLRWRDCHDLSGLAMHLVWKSRSTPCVGGGHAAYPRRRTEERPCESV